MAVKFLDKTGLGYFWGKIKAWCNATFAAIAHTHTSYAVKHSYTTAANQAKAWLRIANANTHQMDTSKPLHVQFLLTAWNPNQGAAYYEQWFVNCQIYGATSGLQVFGNSTAPFSQIRVLYENTVADIDTNDRPAIDIYLNYALATACHIEIQEVYNSGWTFLTNGVLAASTIPTGFENRAVGIQGSGIHQATNAGYSTYTSLQRSNVTANITLANSDTYRMRVLNCTNAITVRVPSIDNTYAWFLIKNFNAASTNKNVTIHPSTTSVLIDDSNADIVLKPGEWVIIASKAANSYTLISDGRWKSQKANDADVVHITGTETVTGAKTFSSEVKISSVNALRIKSSNYGAFFRNDNSTFYLLVTASGDADGTWTTARPLTVNLSNGKCSINGNAATASAVAWSGVTNKPTTIADYGITDAKIANGTITLGSNSITPLTSHQALPTLSKTDSGSGNAVTDISVSNHAITVTKGSTFLTSHQSLSNYVTLNGAQTITGTKTVTTDFIMYDDDPSITFKYKTPVRGTAPSTSYYTTVTDIKDKNGYRFGGLYHEYLTNRGNTLSLIVYNGLSTNSDEWSRLQIGYDNSGIPFTTAVNPPAAATDNQIATCKWVTNKGYLTSHQSLSSCVKTSGNQDIAGYKVFTTSLTVKRVNPYVYFIETDATKGGTTSTDYQGLYFCDKNFDSTSPDDNYTLAQIARVGATANENMVIITAKTNTASTNTGYSISFGHTGGKTTSDWYLLPSGNGVVKLGSNAHRWGQIYSSVSTISTSDARVKNSIADVSDSVLDAWDQIEWKQFKFNSSVEEKGFDAARFHTGVIAQNIESVFNDSGLDARRYGLFCYDEWEAEADVVNSQGSLLREGGPAGNLYSIRYEEALCMEAAYQRRKNKILENRISELERQISDMLQILQNLTNSNG